MRLSLDNPQSSIGLGFLNANSHESLEVFTGFAVKV
jgi:hypothetical protein